MVKTVLNFPVARIVQLIVSGLASGVTVYINLAPRPRLRSLAPIFIKLEKDGLTLGRTCSEESSLDMQETRSV